MKLDVGNTEKVSPKRPEAEAEPESRAPGKETFGKYLRITVAANQGGRRYMEDRLLVHIEREPDGQVKYAFVGVFDGHGGAEASEFVRINLLRNIVKSEKFDSNDDEDILDAIREGFIDTHNQMRNVYENWPHTASGYLSTAGTTVSCVFIRNGKMYTGHVGDSAIFLGEGPGFDVLTPEAILPIRITVDHKPENLNELKRIRAAGGDVAIKSGVARVIWKRPINGLRGANTLPKTTLMESIPFLSVARSLGDLWSLSHATNEYIVSPVPDVEVREIEESYLCLVLASDGLTNVMRLNHVMSVIETEERATKANGQNPNHARALLKNALSRWRSLRADNVSVATIMFDKEEIDVKEEDFIDTLTHVEPIDTLLTDRPDSMIYVTPQRTLGVSTMRMPLLYSGTKDNNFCCVSYRGPGFRTHEEELVEEERHLRMRAAAQMDKPFIVGINGVVDENDDDDDGGGEFLDADDIRQEVDIVFGDADDVVVDANGDVGGGGDENNELDGDLTPYLQTPSRPELNMTRMEAQMVESTVVTTSPRGVVVARRLARFEAVTTSTKSMATDDAEGTDEEDSEARTTHDMLSPKHKESSDKKAAKTPPSPASARPKCEAQRRLRTPKMRLADDDVERRVTRSSSSVVSNGKPANHSKVDVNENGTKTPSRKTKIHDADETTFSIKTRAMEKRESLVATRELRTPSRKSPAALPTPKSRKRRRDAEPTTTCTMTPMVSQLSLECFAVPTPSGSRSAPSTPVKTWPATTTTAASTSTTKTSSSASKARRGTWSVSKLDDGVSRARRRQQQPPHQRRRNDDDDDLDVEKEAELMTLEHLEQSRERTAMGGVGDASSGVEPPSKIRRIYGFMRRLVGFGDCK